MWLIIKGPPSQGYHFPYDFYQSHLDLPCRHASHVQVDRYRYGQAPSSDAASAAAAAITVMATLQQTVFEAGVMCVSIAQGVIKWDPILQSGGSYKKPS